jgi:spore germination protein GerM
MTRRVVVLVLALVVTACGVPADPAPRVLATDDIPYGLLEEAPPPTVAPPAASVATAPVFVYFVKGERMFAVVRQVNADPSVAKALTALLFGPQEDEAVDGVRSAISPTAAIQARAIDPATYLVDLSSEFAQGSVSEQVLGLAQVVWTATAIPGVTGVRFTLNGAPIQVPTPTGSTGDPVGREAFAEVAPVPVSIDPNLPE